ncbi:hypothetical protein Geob_3232 [Geotalea daltonii FRC-32]|uniref:Uncharacterized protein n=1 Tax=Geotalea daltonii (strain DSM 22248 / JCM 15807 / FRC-32) TaxID=316067 RepID=B9M4C0_GEODF|nr:DUF2007 domain-containing protein [Geotalea daltonii]ACM21575.1 hypothetical protein Geob_3232 [Geotalea daltonii FRC-32]
MRKKVRKELDDKSRQCREASTSTILKPTVVVETTDAYEFTAAIKLLEKEGIPFCTEKEYTDDLVEGRSFLGPYAWKIIVEDELRQKATRLIDEGGVSVVIDAPDEGDETTIERGLGKKDTSYWIAIFYCGLGLLSLGMLLKNLFD